MKYNLLFGLLLVISNVLLSQKEYEPATSSLLITNAKVITEAGEAPRPLQILIENGRITEIAQKIETNNIVRTLSLDSLYVYPGFILTSYILSEKKERDDRKNLNYWNPDDERVGITPGTSVEDKLKGDVKIKYTDLNKSGFTIAQVFPGLGFLPGNSSIIILANELEDKERIIRTKSGYLMNMDASSPAYPQTKIARFSKLDQLLTNSKESEKNKDAEWYRQPNDANSVSVLKNVTNRAVPLYINGKSINSLRESEDIMEEHNINVVPVGIKEVNSNYLKETSFENVALNLEKEDKLDSAEFMKSLFDLGDDEKSALWKKILDSRKAYYSMPFNSISKISFAVTSNKSFDVSDYFSRAMNNGVDAEKLLEAVTINPAELLGLSDYSGKIAKNYIGNLTITDKPIDSSGFKISGIVLKGNYKEISKKSKKSNISEKLIEKLSGSWNLVINSPEGELEATLIINSENPSNSQFTIPSMNISTTVSDFKAESENDISWNISVDIQGQEIDASFSGKLIEENKIEGQLTASMMGTMEFTGTKNPK